VVAVDYLGKRRSSKGDQKTFFGSGLLVVTYFKIGAPGGKHVSLWDRRRRGWGVRGGLARFGSLTSFARSRARGKTGLKVAKISSHCSSRFGRTQILWAAVVSVCAREMRDAWDGLDMGCALETCFCLPVRRQIPERGSE